MKRTLTRIASSPGIGYTRLYKQCIGTDLTHSTIGGGGSSPAKSDASFIISDHIGTIGAGALGTSSA